MHVEYWRKSEVFNYTDNRKSIKDISKMFEEKTLIVDESYQRRSVWGEKDKVRLVETVLLNLIIPVLFFLIIQIIIRQIKPVKHSNNVFSCCRRINIYHH